MSARSWAFVLAVGSTATALCLSVLAGWQRGGTLPERLIWIAIGMVLVTSAHLLPALIRDAPLAVRGLGSVLWAACLATACYGHAVFFVNAQQHAGELRASAVPLSGPVGRSLTVVMAERAGVIAQLASANARRCTANCTTLEAHRMTLAARLDALNAEADDIRRQHVADDRVATQRDALRADPVALRLAALLGATAARVDLVSGLMFAAVLEGVACLLWTVALRESRSTLPAVSAEVDVTQSAVATVSDATKADQLASVASRIDKTVSSKELLHHRDGRTRNPTSRDAPIAPLRAVAGNDNHLSQLVQDVATGRLRPTVAGIRRHLGCSQARAIALRRQLAEHNLAA
ncbi:hypothetical protein LGN12_00090 [Burkholderia multivorans]|nr:hypothetical protein [Burkholderia multivorans]